METAKDMTLDMLELVSTEYVSRQLYMVLQLCMYTSISIPFLENNLLAVEMISW